MNSARVPHSPRWAAAWKVSSAPSAPARMLSGSERSPVTGSAPSSLTTVAEPAERASARTVQPSETSRRISRPPMKPDPPVTKAVPLTRVAARVRVPSSSEPMRSTRLSRMRPSGRSSRSRSLSPGGAGYPSSPGRLAAQSPFDARPDHSHRAARLARPPRRRGAERGDRVAARARRRAARARDAHPRLSQGQGARRDRDPEGRPRRRARTGRARFAARMVRAGDPQLRRFDRRRSEAEPRRPAGRRASRCDSRSRSRSRRRPSSATTRAWRSARASPRSPTRRSITSWATCARASAVSRPSSARPTSGDFLVMDFVGKVDGEPFEGGEARDYLLELGSGRLVDGFEEQLTGAKAGDTRHGRGRLSPRTTAPRTWPASTRSSRSRSRRSRSRSCRS